MTTISDEALVPKVALKKTKKFICYYSGIVLDNIFNINVYVLFLAMLNIW